MKLEELVKRLRAIVIIDEVRSDNPLCNEAADLIERQAKALEEAEMTIKEIISDADVFRAASFGLRKVSDNALATIRAARGGKEDAASN